MRMGRPKRDGSMKNKATADAVRDALAALERIDLESCRQEAAAIIAESSYSEAMLIGTPSTLIAIARELLQLVRDFQEPNAASRLEDAGIVSRGEQMSDSIKHLFDENADVWPVCVCIAPDEQVQRAVTKTIKG
jgi:hypothetical protein